MDAIAFTVDEWCARRRVSRVSFYRLQKRGEARRVLIALVAASTSARKPMLIGRLSVRRRREPAAWESWRSRTARAPPPKLHGERGPEELRAWDARSF